MVNALDLIDAAIADLEAKLHLAPGESLPNFHPKESNNKEGKATVKTKKSKAASSPSGAAPSSDAANLPDICKLEFKVGQIVKVWPHPDADKLYCEEIDVGEEKVRSIASGLRHHFTTDQMLGQKVLVVANLKTKSLVGFPSHGMVLCAVEQSSSAVEGETISERIEFVQPPADAVVGEVITYDGLPPPQPWTPAQVEKKKVFAACMEGMKTTTDGLAAWNGHVFMTSEGPCRTATIKGGSMR
jgi:methionine--tRNA ligase beta chain